MTRENLFAPVGAYVQRLERQVAALETQVTQLRSGLLRFGVHAEECARYGTDPNDRVVCTCGLSALAGRPPGD